MHKTAPLQLELTISLRGKNYKPSRISKAWASSGRVCRKLVLKKEINCVAGFNRKGGLTGRFYLVV